MAYADYAYYVETFYGDLIPEDLFDKYISRAGDYIDRLTMNRAKDYTADDSVKKAACAVAEQYMLISNARATITNGEIASETVGSHSVTYRSGADTVTALKDALSDVAAEYLSNTGLLYRGVPYVHATCCDFDFG